MHRGSCFLFLFLTMLVFSPGLLVVAQDAAVVQKTESGDATAQHQLCVDASKKEKKKEAAKWCQSAAEQGDAEAQWHVGNMYEQGQGVLKDLQKAMEWYRKAADRGNATAQASLGHFFVDVYKDYAEGVKWYSKAAEQDDHTAQFNLAQMYSNGQGVRRDFVKAYTLAARGEKGLCATEDCKRPGFNLLRQSLLDIQSRSIKQMTADQVLEVLRLRPGVADDHYELGIALHDKGDLQGAEACYREAIRLKPDDASYHYNLGLLFAHKQNLDAAIAEYRETLRLNPNNNRLISWTHNGIGNMLSAKGDTNGAMAEFREALRFDPKNERAQNNLKEELQKSAPGIAASDPSAVSAQRPFRLSPPDKSFEATFPGEPTHEKRMSKTSETHAYWFEDSVSKFGLIYAQMASAPPADLKPGDLLDDATRLDVTKFGSLLDAKPMTIKGKPAKEVTIGAGDSTIHARYIYLTPRFYTLYVYHPIGAPHLSFEQQFFDSFSVPD